MEYDAFTGGVAPGGLRSKSDIRILICYMLKSVNAPLSGDDIIKVLQEKSLANYFEASDALSALVSLGNVTREEDNTYVLTKRGKSVADDLEQLIPSSVRDKAVAAATALLASAKMERENVATIVRTENGYNVTCHISGGEMELMSLTVYVPDLYQAREVKKNFHRDPQRVYNLMLAALMKSAVNPCVSVTFKIPKSRSFCGFSFSSLPVFPNVLHLSSKNDIFLCVYCVYLYVKTV